jgi:hypothetical protein
MTDDQKAGAGLPRLWNCEGPLEIHDSEGHRHSWGLLAEVICLVFCGLKASDGWVTACCNEERLKPMIASIE